MNFPYLEEVKDGNVPPTGGRQVPAISEGFIGDDDIVARQLKEAAEKENDPLLKEKLLMEYHAYKRAVESNQPSKTESDREGFDNNP